MGERERDAVVEMTTLAGELHEVIQRERRRRQWAQEGRRAVGRMRALYGSRHDLVGRMVEAMERCCLAVEDYRYACSALAHLDGNLAEIDALLEEEPARKGRLPVRDEMHPLIYPENPVG